MAAASPRKRGPDEQEIYSWHKGSAKYKTYGALPRGIICNILHISTRPSDWVFIHVHSAQANKYTSLAWVYCWMEKTGKKNHYLPKAIVEEITSTVP